MKWVLIIMVYNGLTWSSLESIGVMVTITEADCKIYKAIALQKKPWADKDGNTFARIALCRKLDFSLVTGAPSK